MARDALIGVAGVFSPRLLTWPDAAGLLGASRTLPFPTDDDASRVDRIACFDADRQSARWACSYAARHEVALVHVRPGMIRSVGIHGAGEQPLSLWMDEVGDPFDAEQASRFELTLADPAWSLSAELAQRAARCMESMRNAGLSRDNHGRPGFALGPRSRERVLVVDQARSDATIEQGDADGSSFDRMLQAAIAEHPQAEIVVAQIADAWQPPCLGHLTVSAAGRVRVLDEARHAADLLADVDHVYVVTSTVGMEALIAGKPVTCFGAPFYAGWGLTRDRVATPRRRKGRTLEELFAAAYLCSTHYVHPETHEACELESVLAYLTLQRETFARNRGQVYCFGFTPWKFGYVRGYLRSPGSRVRFPRSARYALASGFGAESQLLVWGLKDRPEVRALGERYGVPVWRMEDGFLRSVGLGSDRTVPASLVVDKQGIYFDPTQPSDLESILEAGGFSDAELERAQALRTLIVASRISKYNVGDRRALPTKPADGRRVVLVPGQVEDDASIQLGCEDICTNEGLLRAARECCPNDYVIFKPHPDVSSGNRKGAVSADVLARLADEVVIDAPLPACLEIADEVHTMTSLVGFEALLRGLAVHAYGRPFYAGWGLTHDRHPVARRTRRLTVDELVAGTLLRYPRYLSLQTGLFTTPERVITELRQGLAKGDSPIREPMLFRKTRKAWNAVRGMLDAF